MCCRSLAMPTATMWLGRNGTCLNKLYLKHRYHRSTSRWNGKQIHRDLSEGPDEFTQVIQHILQHSSLQGELCAALEEPCKERIIWGFEWSTRVESMCSTSCALFAFSCPIQFWASFCLDDVCGNVPILLKGHTTHTTLSAWCLSLTRCEPHWRSILPT